MLRFSYNRKKKTSFITESFTQDEEYENLALVILPVFIKYETQLLAFYPLNGITFGIMNAKSLTKSTKPQTCKNRHVLLGVQIVFFLRRGA